jgi:DNA-binding MarR family transcriptional regulator
MRRLAAARRKMKQLLLLELEGTGLTPPQLSVLLVLAEEGEVCLGGLARRAGTDEPTASRVVTRLVQAGYVRMKPDAEDRRRARIALTPSGRAQARKLGPVIARVEAALFKGLEPDALAILSEGLSRVATNAQEAAEALEATPPRRVPRTGLVTAAAGEESSTSKVGAARRKSEAGGRARSARKAPSRAAR